MFKQELLYFPQTCQHFFLHWDPFIPSYRIVRRGCGCWFCLLQWTLCIRSEILWHKSPAQENCLSLCSHMKPFPFPGGFRMAKPNRAHSSWVDKRCGQEFLAKIRTGRVSPPPSPPTIYGWPLGLALRKMSRTVTRNWGNTILGTFKTETTRLEVR